MADLVLVAHQGIPCDPPIVDGVEFIPLGEDDLYVGECSEEVAAHITRIPEFTRFGGARKPATTPLSDPLPPSDQAPDTGAGDPATGGAAPGGDEQGGESGSSEGAGSDSGDPASAGDQSSADGDSAAGGDQVVGGGQPAQGGSAPDTGAGKKPKK